MWCRQFRESYLRRAAHGQPPHLWAATHPRSRPRRAGRGRAWFMGVRRLVGQAMGGQIDTGAAALGLSFEIWATRLWGPRPVGSIKGLWFEIAHR